MAREVGITIKVNDQASKQVNQITKAIDGTNQAARKMEDTGKQSAGGFGRAMQTLDATVRVAEKAFRAFAGGIGAVISKSLEFRKAGDPMLTWFKDMKRENELVQARMGDILLPIVKAVGDAFSGATGQMSDWFSENRVEITNKLVGALEAVGKMLIEGVHFGLVAVGKAWYGWRMVIDASKQVFLSFFSMVLGGISSTLRTLGNLTKGISKSLSDAMIEAADTTGDWSKTMDEAAGQAEASLRDVTDGMNEYEKTANNVAKIAATTIKTTADAARKNAETMVAGSKMTVAEQEAIIKKSADERLAIEKQMIQEAIDADESWTQHVSIERDKRIAIEKAAADKTYDTIMQVIAAFEQLGAQVGKTFRAIQDGQMTASQGAREMAITAAQIGLEMLQKIVLQAAVEAAVRAYAVNQSIPIIGPVVGAAAAATAMAAVKGYLSAMAGGGEVRGGMSGRDSVPALLTPGERVLTVQENNLFKRLAYSVSQPRTGNAQSGMHAMARGGEVYPLRQPRNARGGVINVQVNTLAISTRSERKRVLMSMARELEQLQGQGLIATGAA